MADIRKMTIGQVVDYVIAYNERNKVSESTSKGKPARPKKRLATQAEIDAFLG